MNKNNETEQKFLLEIKELRAELDVSQQRLQEANELMQAEKAERKRVEDDFVRAQTLAESVVETIREPLLVLGADLKVISANQSFCQTFKVTPEETEGRFIYSVGNHQWNIPALRKLLEEIVPQNSHFNDFEFDHEFPAIGPKRMLLNARRIYRQGQGTEMILLAIEDITERKQTERVLEVSETRYRRLFETAQDGILIINADTGQIADVNPFLIEMLGYSREDLLGKRLWEIGAFKDIEASQTAFSELQTKGYVRYEDLPLQTRDGRSIDVEFVSNVYLVDHQCVIQCNIRDINQRKRAEDALRKAHYELEMRVQERTAELARANEELRQEMARREKAEEHLRQAMKLEAIGTLTGGIAHDFNNILGVIVINSELALLDLPVGAGIRNNLDLILKAGLHGKDLVHQMLLFSRKSEKKQEVLTLTPLIKETFKLLRSSIPTTIEMKLHLETESDAIFADSSQIQQVIMNLCTNAAYAMRGMMGVIDIRLQERTFGPDDLPEADMQPGDYLVLSVKDTGSGMDDEVKKRILEPFFTTKPVGEGTGLGLPVVHGIVKGHKGNLTVYSEPGKGSIFKVYLPRVDTGVYKVAETLGAIPGGKEWILLVDDEEMTINSVRNMLQHLGYKVTAYMDSRDALNLFSADPFQFDLVMTDQTMPFMSGEHLGKEVMRIRPDIPVILCTGYSDMISSEKATTLGFQGFIMKPFTVREGAELVRSVLDLTRS